MIPGLLRFSDDIGNGEEVVLRTTRERQSHLVLLK